ncbi:methanol/ethanol family PQQ-dependent dehydrogenase [Roseisolibacter agri]|uniref:Methanol dehydrogenase n=1 Tax=Roseisolibacter agri TaxID=2014610 RepID=A0AA37Q032_9BACT|nr:methanol/ethanol family PQQ-dependent dehydrogenase [Roseisolibacter agri]GLC23919.1 methanol dehydrogenase [Roseisolibacter agri]
MTLAFDHTAARRAHTLARRATCAAALVLAACDADGAPAARAAATDPAADDGQWTMPAKNYASTRYSALAQVTAANVRGLRLAWTFTTDVRRGHEAAPLVVGSTLYVVSPFPNELYALDLANGGALKWTYRPPHLRAAPGVACCDVVNRGAAYADGKLFFNTLDNQVVAVDTSGKEAWRTTVGAIERGETMTMAPLVVKGKVLVGNSGGEFGVRGWLTALDANTGKIAWRAYSTGPDKDVLIGPDFRPFYASERGRDLGVHTWPAGMWRHGGGAVWGWLSYDPELDLVFYGTGNPGPWNADMRPGDNKWTAGLFARDPDTGQARWFYQWNPHDVWDHDGVNEPLLLELPIGGRQRRVIVSPERNGYVYVLDRATGQVLSATPYAHVTTTRGVDTATGRLRLVSGKEPGVGRVVRDICPAAPGAKDWQPSAFSPRTGLVYLPHQNLCMDFESTEANYIEGTPYVGANVRMYPGPGGHRGEVTAWDPVRGRAAWKLREPFPVWSGALATAGDVVFYGTMDRWFKAVDARTGALLWQFRTASGIIGQPITFRGPDGKQYVAILDGVGGWSGAIVAGAADPRDSTVALGFAGAMSDLPAVTNRGGTLYVFALP